MKHLPGILDIIPIIYEQLTEVGEDSRTSCPGSRDRGMERLFQFSGSRLDSIRGLCETPQRSNSTNQPYRRVYWFAYKSRVN
jgi:hypothetical protein